MKRQPAFSLRALFAIFLLFCSGLSATDDGGIVYIYRLRMLQGAMRKMTLALDGKPLGYLQNGRYLALKLAPGAHRISDKKPEDNIEFTVEPSGTYYIRAEFAEAGLIAFNTRFSLSAQPTGESDIRRLKPGDSDQVADRSILLKQGPAKR